MKTKQENSADPQSPGRPFDILLVESETGQLRDIPESLTRNGTPVRTTLVNSSRAAWNRLQNLSQHPVFKLPELILVDFDMPQQDGLRLLEALQADLEFRAIPTLVFGREGNATRFREDYPGLVAEYVRKPNGYGEFMDSLRMIEHLWIQQSRPLPDNVIPFPGGRRGL